MSTGATQPADVAPRVRVKSRPSPLRWMGALLALAVVAFISYSFAKAPTIQWGQVGHYLLDHRLISGLWLTIALTLACMAVGVVGGVILATMRLSDNPVLRSISWWYLLFFRGTPVLVQIILWFNLALVFPTMFGTPTNMVITPFTAAVLGLGLNEAAYMAEIVRAGIESVDAGQREAATSQGLTNTQTLRHVVMPQAMRAIIPPTGNQFIGMLKSTSLVSVIASQELLTQAQQIYSDNFLTVELLLDACIWYLVLTTIATFLQILVEARFMHGEEVPRSVLGFVRRMVRYSPEDVHG